MATTEARERESALERMLCLEVRRLGGRAEKIAPTTKGIPDRLVMLPYGHLELVELKAEDGQLSPAQVLWHTHAAEMGITVTVLSGRAEVLRWLKQRRAEVEWWAHRRGGRPRKEDQS